MKKHDPKRIAAMLAEAAMVGDQAVAKKYGVTDRTVRNWRARRNEPGVQAELSAAKALVAEDWREAAIAFMRTVIGKLDELVKMADSPEHIHAVAGAAKIIGELSVVRDEQQRGEQPPTSEPHPASEVEAQVISIQR